MVMRQRMAKLCGIFATAIIAAMTLSQGTTAFADNNNHPGQGNTNGWITLTPSDLLPGQVVTCTFSSDVSKDKVNLRFKDQNGQDNATSIKITEVSAGTYQFTMPELVQGDTYDLTATVNGTTYATLTVTIPANPGHELPETPYAAALPLVLLAILLLYRKSRMQPKSQASQE